MATIQFKRGDDYLLKVSKIEAELRDKILGEAIYGAAGIVADEIRSALEQVPTDERFGTSDNPTTGPRKRQKEGLMQSLGISSMQDDGSGFLNVKIGFDGYNDIVTEAWPNGQPNQMVARSVASGTSWMQKNDFVKKAVASSRTRAIDFMKASIDKAIAKIMK